MTYSIRFQHTSNKVATSKATARRIVRNEMRAHAGVFASRKPRYIQCEDGLYCYESAADANRDQDGSRAFAVICQPE